MAAPVLFVPLVFAQSTTNSLDQITISTEVDAVLIVAEDGIDDSGTEIAESSDQNSTQPVNDQTPSNTDSVTEAEEPEYSGTELAATDGESTSEPVSTDEELATEPDDTAMDQTTEPEEADVVLTTESDETDVVLTAEPDETAVELATEAENIEIQTRISIENVLLGWAYAWAKQDVEGYFDFYADEFTPDNAKLSRDDWVELRKVRLLKPKKIELNLADIELKINDEPVKQVVFKQSYKSDTFQDRIIKSMTFIQKQSQWKILSEHTVKVL